MSNTYETYSKMIDHALLLPTMTIAELESGCEMAAAYNIASVCIKPYYVKRCAEILNGSTVLPSTVIGFPLGGHTTYVKQKESEQAIADGCVELDMVVNIGQVLSEQWDYVTADIKAVVDITHQAGQKVKVIFENCYLKDHHKETLCRICTELGADWVKTSTGFGTDGATIPDLELMLRSVGPGIQVKAAGGVRDFQMLQQIHTMGVTRCGTSRTEGILNEARKTLGLSPIVIAGRVAATGGSY